MRYLKYLLPLFGLFLILAFQPARSKLFLEGQKIAVSKEQPFAMTLELVAGEELGIEVFHEEGKAGLEDLQIVFKEGEREIQRLPAANARQHLQATQKGFYQVVFELDRRRLNLRFKLFSNKKRDLEAGVPTRLFVITSGFLGVSDRTPESHATFAMPLPEGHTVTIQSNNPENIYYNYTTDHDGGSIQHWVSDNEQFEMEEEGNYSFRLYIDKPKDVSILNFKEFLRARKGLDVNDLTFVVTRPGSAGGSGGLAGEGDSDLQKMMDQLEAQRKADQEAIDKILEGLKQEDTTETVKVGSISGGPLYLPMEGAGVNTLKPALDLKGSGGPCECQSLNVTFGEPQFWVYWIGVGESAMERYTEREKRFQRKMGQIVSLAHLYAKRILDLGTLSAKLPPVEAFFPTDFDEQSIEYAIVEEAHKDAFLRGEAVQPIAAGFLNKNVAFDYGNGMVEIGKAYWLCTRNHYAYSPVSYAFVYETFSINNLIEQ